MNPLELAKAIYSDGKHLIDATRDLSVTDDFLRWTREDLEDALLDLKLAVMEQSASAIASGLYETMTLIRVIRDHLSESEDE